MENGDGARRDSLLVADVHVGSAQALALTTAGEVYTWGRGARLPACVRFPVFVRRIAAGAEHCLALDADARV